MDGSSSSGSSSSGEVESSSGELEPTTGPVADEDESSGSSSSGEPDCLDGDLAVGPAPVQLGDELAVPIDVLGLSGRLEFDVASETTAASAELRFRVAQAGRPIFDLRQDGPWEAILDGVALASAALETRDLGGGPGAEMRVLAASVEACETHTLELRYPITTLVGIAGPAPSFEADGVHWDLGFSDLAPRMFLEQWLPANLIHDRHPISLGVTITGGSAEQRLISNGEVSELAPGEWQIEFPAHSTALSPMLVLIPAGRIESSSQALQVEDGPLVAVELHRTIETPVSSAELHALLADAYAEFSESTGEYAFARFTAVVRINRGMEYDGGTVASVEALRHELFHSWFGRGLKPLRASDGWIDEAWDEYNTGAPSFPAVALTDDDPAVRLYDPQPWSRTTPIAAYDDGKLVFAAIAAEAGVTPLRDSMRDLYEGRVLGQIDSATLERHLACSLGAPAVRTLFHRFVYGHVDPAPPAPADDCR